MSHDESSSLPGGVTITEKGAYISILVQPRASKSRMMGWHNGWLKLALTAPPVDGAANKAVIEFFSKLLKLPKSAVSITAGETSRQKTIFIRQAPVDLQTSLQQLSIMDIR